MEIQQITSCTICADRFSKTHTAHAPRPVAWFDPAARVLIAGQAPGMRVHESGRPFTDPSGDRLRNWMGVGEDVFYDRQKVAIVPMAFCFPGYNAKGHDLPPPKICAKTWRGQVLEMLSNVKVTLLIGSYAQAWHCNDGLNMGPRMENWRSFAPDVFLLPHPSWRNTHWLRKNPWFERDVLPNMQQKLKAALA